MFAHRRYSITSKLFNTNKTRSTGHVVCQTINQSSHRRHPCFCRALMVPPRHPPHGGRATCVRRNLHTHYRTIPHLDHHRFGHDRPRLRLPLLRGHPAPEASPVTPYSTCPIYFGCNIEIGKTPQQPLCDPVPPNHYRAIAKRRYASSKRCPQPFPSSKLNDVYRYFLHQNPEICVKNIAAAALGGPG